MKARFLTTGRSFVAIVGLSAALGACTLPAPDPDPGQSAGKQSFSAEEVRAARALSIFNRTDLVRDSDPYDEALACQISVNELAERVSGMSVIGIEQKQALARAQRVYGDRIARLGKEIGKTREDVAQDLETRRESLTEGPQRIQVAVGCLRRLAGVA